LPSTSLTSEVILAKTSPFLEFVKNDTGKSKILSCSFILKSLETPVRENVR